jgi:large subunit ribosomal protein L22
MGRAYRYQRRLTHIILSVAERQGKASLVTKIEEPAAASKAAKAAKATKAKAAAETKTAAKTKSAEKTKTAEASKKKGQ